MEVLAVFLEHPGVLFIPDIADPLEEEQRQDVALPVGPIDRRATQDVGSFPKLGLDIVTVVHAHKVLLRSFANWDGCYSSGNCCSVSGT